MKKYGILNKYEDALNLLDQYDHQEVEQIKGNKSIDILNYQESREIIDSMKFNDVSDVFGVEKEDGKLNGILVSIEQTAFGQELYSSSEEKAANLLYFIVKNHSFVDGNKRIAASIFLHFLYTNDMLYYANGDKKLSDSALVAITILIAESRPEEKDTIIKLIMNFLVL